MDVGYLWVLRKLLDRSPDAEIEAFVASWEPHFQGGGGSIVYPTATRRWLPKDPGEGLERFHSWVAAPSGRPATRASRFIGEFTSAPAEGYVLTHQIFVLQWAEDTGLALPREVSERRPRLLDRLLEEHTGDPRAGDLDFERALLLLMYADVDVNRATRWVDRILDAWDSDEKRWTFEGRETIHFEGRRYEFRHGPDHPTAMALGSVKTYLDRFALPAPGGVPR